MVSAVSASLSSGPHTARTPTRTSPCVYTTSTASARRRPRNSGPLKGVVALVDVRVGADAQIDCSDVVARKLRELGAYTVKRLTPKITHMVLSHFTRAWKTKIAKWQGSGGSMAAAATRYGLKIVSQLWVNACYVSKKRMDERPFFPVSQQNIVESSVSTAKPKLVRLGAKKRRQSMGGEDSEAADTQARHTAGAIIGNRIVATTTPASVKVLNRSRRKRALSMEPMTSDNIIKMLGLTIKVSEVSTPKKQMIESKSVSSSAKRRKTLNGPLTQQDEDEVTVSQASKIVADGESEHDNEGEEKANEAFMIQDGQTSSQPLASRTNKFVGSSASTSTPSTSSCESVLNSSDNEDEKRPTARELRRHNRNSLSYGGGLTLKSGIWSCGACGCSNPRSHNICSDCQISKGFTKSPGDESIGATLCATIGATAVVGSPKTPITPTASTSTLDTSKEKFSTFAKKLTASDSVSYVKMTSDCTSVLQTPSHSAALPTVISAAKVQLSSPTAIRVSPTVTKNNTSSPAALMRTRSPDARSFASKQAMRSSLGSASLDLPKSRKPLNAINSSSALSITQNVAKKRAGLPTSFDSLTTPVVKKVRRCSDKESTLEKRPMITPGSVSGFIRKHREVNSTPFPMAMKFASTTSRKAPRKSPRNVFGITGVSSETRGVLQCAIHAIDAHMANEVGHRKARVVKSIDYAAGVTHLIVGRDAKRTIKVLFAIARGAWIVTEDWAFSSLEQERWLPEENYELTVFANKYSREHPESRQIFKSTKFFVGSNVEPSREVLQSLIQVAGGEICNQISVADICICGDASLFRRAQRVGIRVVTPKWVYDSIATMKLKDDAGYAFTVSLDTPVKTPSKSRRAVESFGTPAFTPAKRRPNTTLGLEDHSIIPE